MDTQTIKRQIEELDPNVHGSLKNALAIKFNNNGICKAETTHADDSDRFAGIFRIKVDEINKIMPNGTIPYIRKNHPDLYKETNNVEQRLNHVWKNGLQGRASLEEFRAVLEEWFALYMKAAELFTITRGI